MLRGGVIDTRFTFEFRFLGGRWSDAITGNMGPIQSTPLGLNHYQLNTTYTFDFSSSSSSGRSSNGMRCRRNYSCRSIYTATIIYHQWRGAVNPVIY